MVVVCIGKFVVVSVIVIGGNQEYGVWINWFVIKGQVFNFFRIGINYLVFVVIMGGLGNINLIIYIINNIKVISVEIILVDE